MIISGLRMWFGAKLAVLIAYLLNAALCMTSTVDLSSK